MRYANRIPVNEFIIWSKAWTMETKVRLSKLFPCSLDDMSVRRTSFGIRQQRLTFGRTSTAIESIALTAEKSSLNLH